MRGSLINQILGLLLNNHELIRVILGQLEVYMVINFGTREINRDACKLVSIPTLILKKNTFPIQKLSHFNLWETNMSSWLWINLVSKV
jgi:hypothetical protein